jgi:predicted nucleotidyltransferase
MWTWLKEFIRDYVAWTFLDWLVYTRSGHAFIALVGLGIMSAAARLMPFLASYRHELGAAVLALSVAAIITVLFEMAVVARRRLARPVLPRTIAQEQILHENAADWLRKRLVGRTLKVQHAGLFGSILSHHYKTSDVDVAVLIEPVSKRRFRYIARELRSVIAEEFRNQFGHRLQVQLFAATEMARFDDFCSRDSYESLF